MSRTGLPGCASLAAGVAAALALAGCGASSNAEPTTTGQSAANSTGSISKAHLLAAREYGVILYVECLRAHGFNAPLPNFPKDGPVYKAPHVDTTSAAFKRVSPECVAKAEASVKKALR
jgi:hypothetical protein